MLEMIGYKGDIKCFQSSQSALNFIVRNSLVYDGVKRRIDMIITDVDMMVVDGFQMVQ